MPQAAFGCRKPAPWLTAPEKSSVESVVYYRLITAPTIIHWLQKVNWNQPHETHWEEDSYNKKEIPYSPRPTRREEKPIRSHGALNFYLHFYFAKTNQSSGIKESFQREEGPVVHYQTLHIYAAMLEGARRLKITVKLIVQATSISFLLVT